jgi:hypothetical protein
MAVVSVCSMILVVFLFGGLYSPVSACDRCVRRSTAAYQASSLAQMNGEEDRHPLSSF